MLHISIPGSQELKLKNLILDYNGTLAVDGRLLPTTLQRLELLAQDLDIHIVTADTHGSVEAQTGKLTKTLHVIGATQQDLKKKANKSQKPLKIYLRRI